jgi:glycosyltransferase involved in cell wall biosynthesis
MRIALIAPPFICVPPKMYGGTELFIAQVAEGLKKRRISVVVYTNGESEIDVERRWLYDKAQWPIQGEIYDNLKDINHTSWSIADAARDCDIVHLNNIPGLAQTRFVDCGFVYTIHHPHVDGLSEFYQFFPEVQYVTISDFQRQREKMPRIRTIHHGIDLNVYEFRPRKQQYLTFLGRIAPIKGTHSAIQVAKKSGIPLKIAGEIQPLYRDYWESQIKPNVDGKFIEYIGEADLSAKNELLGNSLAMLFPIGWDEPFGLVMIEAMACGTPVLAFSGGSVPEIVKDGVSGYICKSVDEMVMRVKNLAIPAETIRSYTEQNFTLDRMVDQYVQLYEEIARATAARRAGASDTREKLPEKNRAIA